MLQTVKKLKDLFVYKDIVQPSRPNISKPFSAKHISSPSNIPEQEIAERAFMIWQERGCSHGNDREDWLLATFQLEDERSYKGLS